MVPNIFGAKKNISRPKTSREDSFNQFVLCVSLLFSLVMHLAPRGFGLSKIIYLEPEISNILQQFAAFLSQHILDSEAISGANTNSMHPIFDICLP